VVQVILQDAEMRQLLRDEHLRRIPDLQAIAKKLGRKKAGLHDCYRCSKGHVPCLHNKTCMSRFAVSSTAPPHLLLEYVEVVMNANITNN
jgi:DNA mismatch repair ATPase MutS